MAELSFHRVVEEDIRQILEIRYINHLKMKTNLN